MKKSELSFMDGYTIGYAINMQNQNKLEKAFDWAKAARIINERHKLHPDLIAEAGLQRDWDYTGGVIFQCGEPVSHEYTYLKSTWAIPTLILSWDGKEQEEIECYEVDGKYESGSKWDEESVSILNEVQND